MDLCGASAEGRGQRLHGEKYLTCAITVEPEHCCGILCVCVWMMELNAAAWAIQAGSRCLCTQHKVLLREDNFAVQVFGVHFRARTLP